MILLRSLRRLHRFQSCTEGDRQGVSSHGALDFKRAQFMIHRTSDRSSSWVSTLAGRLYLFGAVLVLQATRIFRHMGLIGPQGVMLALRSSEKLIRMYMGLAATIEGGSNVARQSRNGIWRQVGNEAHTLQNAHNPSIQPHSSPIYRLRDSCSKEGGRRATQHIAEVVGPHIDPGKLND